MAEKQKRFRDERKRRDAATLQELEDLCAENTANRIEIASLKKRLQKAKDKTLKKAPSTGNADTSGWLCYPMAESNQVRQLAEIK